MLVTYEDICKAIEYNQTFLPSGVTLDEFKAPTDFPTQQTMLDRIVDHDQFMLKAEEQAIHRVQSLSILTTTYVRKNAQLVRSLAELVDEIKSFQDKILDNNKLLESLKAEAISNLKAELIEQNDRAQIRLIYLYQEMQSLQNDLLENSKNLGSSNLDLVIEFGCQMTCYPKRHTWARFETLPKRSSNSPSSSPKRQRL